ncbi:MAG: protein kinase [Pirellulaceae bacterium]|nr:protein kinase [Planctomycetales bacterium]
MSDDFHGRSGGSDPSQLDRIDAICDKFERSWRGGQGPIIEQFLANCDDRDRSILMRELIALEVALRLGANETFDTDEYHQRFSADRSVVEAALYLCQQGVNEASFAPTAKYDLACDARAPQAGPDVSEAETPQAIGRYQVIRSLGRGGFADVYLASDPDLEREVALKVPRMDRFSGEAALDFFVEEARKAAQLDHPGIVRIYDVHREAGLVAIVQQYLSGGDLTQYAGERRLPYRQVAEMVLQIANAIGYAHRRHYIHLDLKPANILLDQAGKPYVADFGIALHESRQRELRGEVIGTYAYMSPDQVRGETHRLDGRADIWSLGIIMYELLTGRRPFFAETPDDMRDQIENTEPRPPRQLDPNIPRELARICLVCLSKKVTDRYTATADLIDDLQHWLANGESKSMSRDAGLAEEVIVEQVIPQGLRSFGAEHSGFYLSLLPGPHDRDGLPKAVRVWKTGIESRDAEVAFSVGLLYGPSGCGKSSLVRAGILPSLDNNILPIYVEATAADTEVRLLKGLRKIAPDIDSDTDVVAALSRVREIGGWQGKKVLLVIDQFEQWLHAHHAYDDSQLLAALRQCNGSDLQTLLLVRDDFGASVHRFFQHLEIELSEGHNYALFDLFDLDHAQHVLAAFGRAYGKIRRSSAELSSEQAQFLAQAVRGLAEREQVVSVRLSVFAEMMKGRSWIPAALTDVGGLEGLGMMFLEETFAAKSAPPSHRAHQQAARRMLKSLLPEQDSEIKGQMQSHRQLQEVSGYRDRPADFRATLNILDNHVRLITPTEPDKYGADITDTPRDDDDETRYYQLSHDYMVPSLRRWLYDAELATYSGRCRVLLDRITRDWKGHQQNRRFLPGPLEFFRILTGTRKSQWTRSQTAMMAHARAVYVRVLAAIAFAFLFVATVAVYWNQRTQTDLGVARVLAAPIQEVDKELASQHGVRERVLNRLREMANDPNASHANLVRIHLARLPDEPELLVVLREYLTGAPLDEYVMLRDELKTRKDELIPDLWPILRESANPPRRRFLAGLTLADYAPDSGAWQDSDYEYLCNQMVRAPAAEQTTLREALQPIGVRLLDALESHFLAADSEDLNHNLNTTLALRDFARVDAKRQARLLALSNPQQFSVLIDEYSAADADFRDSLALNILQMLREQDLSATNHLPDDELVKVGRARANLAASLIHLGQGNSIVKLLGNDVRFPDATRQFVHNLKDLRIDATKVERLANHILARADSVDVSVAAADTYLILLALSNYGLDEFGTGERDRLVERVSECYRHHVDSGVHSASELLLRRWGHLPTNTNHSVTETAAVSDGTTGWFTRSIGNSEWTFAVIDRGDAIVGAPPTEDDVWDDELQRSVSLDHRFAIATREVSISQWEEFAGQLPVLDVGGTNRDESDRLSLPAGNVSWYGAIMFCRWLTSQAGFSELEQCYEAPEASVAPTIAVTVVDGITVTVPIDWPADETKPGFRLPNEDEWEVACRAGSRTAFSFGCDRQWLRKYAWYRDNSRATANAEATAHSVGLLCPNRFGLFDMHGNRSEWCQDASDGSRRAMRGGVFALEARFCRSADRSRYPAQQGSEYTGFRVVRTIGKDEYRRSTKQP